MTGNLESALTPSSAVSVASVPWWSARRILAKAFASRWVVAAQKKINRVQIEGVHGMLGMGGHEHDRNVRPDRGPEAQTIEAGHLDVQEKGVHLGRRGHPFFHFETVPEGRHHFAPALLEQAHHAALVHGLILGDGHAKRLNQVGHSQTKVSLAVVHSPS